MEPRDLIRHVRVREFLLPPPIGVWCEAYRLKRHLWSVEIYQASER